MLVDPKHLASQPDTNAVSSLMEFNSLSPNIAFGEFHDLAIRMAGKHQSDNAAIAIAAWHRLNVDGWSLPRAAVIDAIKETQLSCRIELVNTLPAVVIDTSHNVASIGALLVALNDHYAPSKKTIVFACSKDKEYEKMLDQLLSYADRLIVTQFHNNPRSVPVERLEVLAREKADLNRDVEILSAPSSKIAVEYACRSALPNELVCVTGSFFLASETRLLF